MSKPGFWASPAGQKRALRSTPAPGSRQAAAPSSTPRWGSCPLPWAWDCVTKPHWAAYNSSWLSCLLLEVTSLRSGRGQGRAPSRGPRGGSFLPLPAPGGPRGSLACGCTTPIPAPILMWPLLCGYVFSLCFLLLIRHQLLGQGPPELITAAKILLPSGHSHRYQEYPQHTFGGTQFNPQQPSFMSPVFTEGSEARDCYVPQQNPRGSGGLCGHSSEKGPGAAAAILAWSQVFWKPPSTCPMKPVSVPHLAIC